MLTLSDMWHVVDFGLSCGSPFVSLGPMVKNFISLTPEPLTCTNRNEGMHLPICRGAEGKGGAHESVSFCSMFFGGGACVFMHVHCACCY